ncbi:MAG: FAD-binding protein [Pseudonocardiaceae bacterium]|nr:FAD-binding protein [Pseudonocardiaceae bacterium]
MADLADELRRVLPAQLVASDPDVVAGYRHDEAPWCPSEPPAVVVRPECTEHVAETLRTASALGVPVVAQGARTGLSGAANGIAGCVVLSCERMNRIVEINPADRTAMVEPGVTNAALSRAAAEQGLFYPPDPSSWETSSIGGNISTNAGGLCCVKYGVTSEYVLGLEAVLATGEVLHTGRRTAKGVAGYDLTRLLVGSEGTLAVVTRATLALRPAPPPALTVVGGFGSTAAAGAAVAELTSGGHTPSLLEVMDAPCIRAVNAYRDMGLPTDSAALLLAQSEGDATTDAAAAVAAIGKVFRSCGATDVVEADTEAESELLLAARRLVGPAVFALGAGLVEDVCVPRSRLVALLDGVAAIAARHDVALFVTGHAGDGNMHPVITFDESDENEVARAHLAFDEIMRLALDLGGTITGEHGVGILKKGWLASELGPVSMRLHEAIKKVFDPDGILNPGKLFQPP